MTSSGTVYSVLYGLERNKMVEGMWSKRKRVYQLTEKSEETINIILGAYEKIENFVVTLCK
jgi:DNA-binding PadR family transcriptional regulator